MSEPGRGAGRRATVLVVLVVLATACRPDPPPTPPTTRPLASAPTEPGVQPAEPAKDTEPPPRGILPATPPPEAERLPSGVAIHRLTAGDRHGDPPRRSDRLELRFEVWDEDEDVVGASGPDRTEVLEAAWLPPGWWLAMQTMHEGEHAHVWVPAALAYPDGSDGLRGALRIDVELVAIHRGEPGADGQFPLLAPPPNALRTASGLAFLVLREGTGERHPSRDATVTVHYEGWTTDGTRFDSSVQRGRPATFPLPRVIEGWREALPLMVEGEKSRFWIPAELAYGNAPGKPQGMLIFDIELLSIED